MGPCRCAPEPGQQSVLRPEFKLNKKRAAVLKGFEELVKKLIGEIALEDGATDAAREALLRIVLAAANSTETGLDRNYGMNGAQGEIFDLFTQLIVED